MLAGTCTRVFPTGWEISLGCSCGHKAAAATACVRLTEGFNGLLWVPVGDAVNSPPLGGRWLQLLKRWRRRWMRLPEASLALHMVGESGGAAGTVR